MAKLASGGTPFTDSKLETQMGDIVVFVPEGLGVNVRAAVGSRRGSYGIRSEFGELKITHPSGNMGPREFYAEGSLYWWWTRCCTSTQQPATLRSKEKQDRSRTTSLERSQ